MFDNLPEKYRSPLYFALFGFILSQIVPVISSLVYGKKVTVFGCTWIENNFDSCHPIIPTNEYEWGGFIATTTVWVIGALFMYWWEIGRKKTSDSE